MCGFPGGLKSADCCFVKEIQRFLWSVGSLAGRPKPAARPAQGGRLGRPRPAGSRPPAPGWLPAPGPRPTAPGPRVVVAPPPPRPRPAAPARPGARAGTPRRPGWARRPSLLSPQVGYLVWRGSGLFFACCSLRELPGSPDPPNTAEAGKIPGETCL
mgnify:CR=1 FL=1